MSDDSKVTSLRFGKTQREYFEKLKILIEKSHDKRVSTTWIIKQMMAYGQDRFHEHFHITFKTLKEMEVPKENV